MSQRREPSPPPDLPGHTYVQLLGSGGFADVYLYERELPRMPVAVKVLVGGALTRADELRFTAEANTMARFSGHPYIVGVLNAGVSSDGRPYIVMQYYPKDNMAVRCRQSLLTISETLQISIQVASAVETAHRAGVLHRDIKPANILTGEFGEPGLTDFGIAGTTGETNDESAGEGLSIPWAPPEAFDSDAVLDERSDVYSLGATVYNLLAGQSPFELPGQNNRAIDLMDRIERMPVPPITRGDVPDSLVRILRQAMAKDPSQRHPSAMAFARDLQGVEQEFRLKMTTVVVPDDPTDVGPRPLDDGVDETRGRLPKRISPQAAAESDQRTRSPGGGGVRGPAVSAQGAGASASLLITSGGVPEGSGTSSAPDPTPGPQIGAVPAPASNRATVDEVTGTRKRPTRVDAAVIDPGVVDETPEPRSRRATVIGLVAAALVAVAVGLAFAFAGHTAQQSPAAPTTTTAPLGSGVPATPEFAATVSGGVATVTWTNPDPQPGDQYDVSVKGLPPTMVSASPYSTHWPPGKPFCVLVQTVNVGRTSSTNGDYQCPAG